MAKYDQGGGCGCGLYKICKCELNMNNSVDFKIKDELSFEIKKMSQRQELKESLHRVQKHGTIEDKVNWLMNRFAENLEK